MPGTASTRFYWNDWQGDPALRLCSLAAQGLWMRMLCIAAEADPIGYVTIGSRPVGATDLARIAGVSEAEVTCLMAELDRYGVFSRDRHSRIYSRRMVRDARKAAENRKNGKLGGNPTIRKDTQKPATVNPTVKPPDKPLDLFHIHKEEREAEASPKKKRRTAIDTDWQPDEQDRAFAAQRGVSHVDQRDVFVNHHVAKGTLSADWHASWRTWILHAVKFAAERGASRGPKPASGNGFIAMARELHDQRGAGRLDEADRSDRGDDPPGEAISPSRRIVA